MTVIRRLLAFALGSLAVVFLVAESHGQQLAWRTDYNAARREAAEKGRQILLDLGTENCFWCKKLDTTTFRDPAVVAMLNQHFIPLRIDADREPGLAQKLQISSYPTLLLATPDGRILKVIEGFLEPARLTPQLEATLAVCQPTPDWMVRDFQEASKAVGLGDNARAITLFKTILEDGKNRPLQAQAREHLQTLQQQADSRLAHARKAQDRGQMLEAITTLTDLLRVYPGTAAAESAQGLLNNLAARPEFKEMQRGQRAAELLALARDDFRTQQFFNCLERCELLASAFGDAPEAKEAARMAAEIKGNPEWLARACNNLNDRLTAMYLELAESWTRQGKPQEAIACLERVRQLAPESAQAQEAVVKLAKLQGKPGLQAEFQKPK